jgi:hypothetical protein
VPDKRPVPRDFCTYLAENGEKVKQVKKVLLRHEGKIDDRQIRKLMGWRHSGFSVYRGNRIAPDDRKAQEALDLGDILDYLDFFEVFSAEDFIAVVTQHISGKNFQMVRYYGWYSNRSREDRREAGLLKPGEEPAKEPDSTVLDVSAYDPPRIPPSTWRQLIKKVWEVDPLCCPRCGEELRTISMIHDPEVIRKILEHLGLWKDYPGNVGGDVRGSPKQVVYESFDDGWSYYKKLTATLH